MTITEEDDDDDNDNDQMKNLRISLEIQKIAWRRKKLHNPKLKISCNFVNYIV